MTARVLILTASYGSGHNEAAHSLAAGFERMGAAVTIVDHFRELVHPRFERVTRTFYYWLLHHAPGVWAAAYGLGDRLSTTSPLTFGATHVGARGLARLLERIEPDAVVSVHATPAAAMSTLAAGGGRWPRHTTVVTDFVAHSQWIARHVDRYCVAADEVQRAFLARGLERDRVLVTGVPVRQEFERGVDPAAARRHLGLVPDLPVVLAMAGSHGSLGRLRDVTRALLEYRRPLQGLVVAGRDEALVADLRRLTAGTRVRVLGYVRDVRLLMGAADLLVTKAGGMTLAEAMAAELPCLLYGSLPGHERRNEQFAARAGLALVARDRRELGVALERALEEPHLLDKLRDAATAVRRPDAVLRIVEAALAGCRA